MVKHKKCPICKKNLIKIASSYLSCSNKNCRNFFNMDGYETVFIDDYANEEEIVEESSAKYIPDDYVEEYDCYLFFSNQLNFISRYEYRQKNNFIEDYLFNNNKRGNYDNYIDDNKISNFKDVALKHKLIDKGRELENFSTNEAFDYYYSLKDNNLFDNDYYIYKKLVKLAADYETQLDLIIEFFNSGIYCNRHHYLWFLKKLSQVCDDIYVSSEVIEEFLYNFKNKGFNNKSQQDYPVVLAEKIKMKYGNIKVITDRQYAYEQFKYELIEEISHLYHHDQFMFMISIYERLIMDCNFKSGNLYEGICVNCHRMGYYKDEIKWIYRYLMRTYNSDHSWCKSRLNNLTAVNEFHHNSLFFDTNENYLSSEDFENNLCKNLKITDYLNSVKEKYYLIEKGSSLEKNPLKAIDYYNSLLDNPLFENDYYLYKSLVLLYDEIGDYENERDILISFFASGIYCDRFNYIFFLYHLSRLYSQGIISYDDVDYYLEFFKNHGFKNQKLENYPVVIGERIINEKDKIDIIFEDDFSNNQYLSSLNTELIIYGEYNMFNHANEVLKILIENHVGFSFDLIKKLCNNYHEINDFENELKVIDDLLSDDEEIPYGIREEFSKRRQDLLKSIDINPDPEILKDPEIEIFFENNENYLSFNDFKENEIRNTELLDKVRAKHSVILRGLKLEHDLKKASEYYNLFLDDELFKNDYYIYRRLVMLYSNFGEFELVYKTIKDFFYSGTYCNRYQYLWFLHKLNDVSRVKFISDSDISNMLRAFKNKGFKNTNFKNNHNIISERFKGKRYSILIFSSKSFDSIWKEYESKEEISQLEINGHRDESAKILRNIIDNQNFPNAKNYMRLCHSYREIGDYESEKKLINEYLSKSDFSKEWFEKRLRDLDKIMN